MHLKKVESKLKKVKWVKKSQVQFKKGAQRVKKSENQFKNTLSTL